MRPLQAGRPEGRPASVHSPESGELTISYLGHETILLEMDGVRLLTDPVLRMRIQLLQRHGPLPDLDATKNLDAVLISHLHLDHVNPASLRLLPRATPLVVPTGARALLRPYRFTDLRELGPGESLRFREVSVTATPARHAGRRYPWGRHAEAVGYMLRGSRNVYFAGDTGLFDGLADLAGDIDVALLPIWGWGLRLPDDHLSPETAAKALRVLRPKVAIPVHWGTFLPLGAHRWYGHYLTDPPWEFVAQAKKYAPEVQTTVLRPGESVKFGSGVEPDPGDDERRF